MAEEQETNPILEDTKPLSMFTNKMGYLLEELDQNLKQVGYEFGPILLNELENRLDIVEVLLKDGIDGIDGMDFKIPDIYNIQLEWLKEIFNEYKDILYLLYNVSA